MNSDRGVVQDFLDYGRITFERNALVTLLIVVVVIVKSYRKPLQYGGGQLRWLHTPLLFCIPVEKVVIELAAEKAQRLLLEIARLLDGGIAYLCKKLFRLRRTHDFAEELVDG